MSRRLFFPWLLWFNHNSLLRLKSLVETRNVWKRDQKLFGWQLFSRLDTLCERRHYLLDGDETYLIPYLATPCNIDHQWNNVWTVFGQQTFLVWTGQKRSDSISIERKCMGYLLIMRIAESQFHKLVKYWKSRSISDQDRANWNLWAISLEV